MRCLRDVEDPTSFLERVRLQQRTGYRLVALSEGDEPIAVAGFRIGENLAWGRFLYVDDLVTLPWARSRGFGSQLLSWLAEFARSEGAQSIQLDSAKGRVDAHRFYEREGLELASCHFRRPVPTE